MSQTKVKSGLLNFPDQTDFVKLPSGTTAQRPSSPEKGYSRYNTTDNKLEYWNGTIWQQLPGVVAPTIESVSYPGDDLAADPAGGQTITLTGTNFLAGAAVEIEGTLAPVVTVVSKTEITFTAPAKTAGDYDIVLTNGDSTTATFIDGITYNGLPSWITPPGNLGTFSSGSTIPTITLVATEPDSGTVGYSVTTGALPSGLTLSGADIDGTVTSPPGQTTYNFSVTASDDENQESTERAFNIVVYLQVVNTVDYHDPFDGNGVALYQLNGNANDVSGNYNGTATNVSYGTGVFDQAGVFNGSTSKIIATNSVSSSTSYSISAWINISDASYWNHIATSWNNDVSLRKFILRVEDASRGNNVNWLTYTSTGSAGNATSSASLSANKWYHIVGTDNNGDLKLYINGSQAAESLGNSASNTTSTENLNIGGRGDYIGSNEETFNGSIEQVRIFNTALTPLEVESLYRERTVICGGQADTLDILGDNSCVATYQLNGNANDLSGNYSGTEVGTISYEVGEFDLAGVFNGSGSSGISTNLITSNTQDLTWSVWVKGLTHNQSGTANSIFTLYKDNYAWLNFNSNGTITGRHRASPSIDVDVVSGVINPAVWTNIVFVSSLSAGNKIYINGSLVDSNTTSITSRRNDVNAGTGLYIGNNPADLSGPYALKGQLDQVRIFNKALSQAEVTTLYNETACDALACSGTTNTLDILSDGSCIAAYPLDGSPADLSGNYNGVQTDVTYPVGKYDLAGSFNGTSSYLDIPSFSFGSSNISISMWVNPNSSQNAYSMLFDFEHSSSSAGVFAIQQNNADTNQYKVWQWNGSGYNISTAFTLSANTWNHLVFTLQSNGSYVFYLGGVSSVSGSGLTSPPSSLIKPLNIGRWQGNPDPGRYFSGSIDQVRIFNKALSAAEVTTLYNETACN